jgi:signal transduction histidine kinase
MRLPIFILLIVGSIPAWGQQVLTITDAQKANPIAPYAYVYRDKTQQLTYDQIARFPLDSFQRLNQQEIVQFGYFHDKIWLRFELKNETRDPLFLISFYRRYKRMEIVVVDETGQAIKSQAGYERPFLSQPIRVIPPVIPIGLHPKMVYISITTIDAYGDYLHIGNLDRAIFYQKKNNAWQSVALGAFLLVFLYALLFFFRLRDPLIGWYALLMFSIIFFYVDFYGFLNPYLDYASWRKYVPSSYIYLLCWSLFHVKFLNLQYYSKTLYWIIIGLNGLQFLDLVISNIVTPLVGHYFSLLFMVLSWLKVDWGGFTLFVLFLLLVSLIYVAVKKPKQVWLYAIAFSISLTSMIIGMFALYNISWLPYVPYTNFFVPGTLIEIIMLGFILAERASRERKNQAQTQQQLITLLQENLLQQNKLLQIRDEIARDLHDEVGATLTGIATSAKVVQKKIDSQQPELKAVLGQMKNDSEEAIHTIRDTIWALNPDNDAPEKLLEKMKTVGFKLLMPHDIVFIFENEVSVSQLPAFSMEQRRNLYLVYKEALHNVAKHSEATHVQVRIFQQDGTLHIRISDDGKGFDSQQIQEGNGLKNFQKRAEEGGFEVNVSSRKGTIVEILVNNNPI